MENPYGPLVARAAARRTRGRSLQQLLQSLIPRPADRQLRAVVEDRQPAVLRVQLAPRQSLDVQQIRPVDPHEPPRIELRLEIPQRLLLQDRLPARVDADVIVLSSQVIICALAATASAERGACAAPVACR